MGCFTVVASVSTLLVTGHHILSPPTEEHLFLVDVSPTGWRRTIDGWERAEDWLTPKVLSPHDINGWLAVERARQSNPAGQLLNGLKAVHPLLHAATLVTSVIVIFLVHERKLGLSLLTVRRTPEATSRISAD